MIEFPAGGDPDRRTIEESRIVDLLMLRGWPIETGQGDIDTARQGAKAALSRLIALGLPYRSAPTGERFFDPVETTNFMVAAGQIGADPTHGERCLPSARRLALEPHGLKDSAGAPPCPKSLGAAHYCVTLQRRFNLAACRPRGPTRLRLPVPLQERSLTGLSVEFLPPADAIVTTSRSACQIAMVVRSSTRRDITAGMRARFTLAAPSSLSDCGHIPADEAALYTHASEGLVRITPQVCAQAARLAGSERDEETVLRRFWNFMLDEFSSGAIAYEQVSPDDPFQIAFEDRVLDCRLSSALLVALCRARGIPARMVSGYMLYVSAPTFHTWVEAWVPGRGWLPLDTYRWALASENDIAAAWRDYFFLQTDHRMVVERMPRMFAGLGDIRFPHRWHMLCYAENKGATSEFRSIETGELIYAEHVEVERLDAQEQVNAEV